MQPDNAMPLRLNTKSADFAARLDAFLATKREAAEDVAQAVRAIVDDVRKRGDGALADYSKKFDRVDLDKMGLRVAADEVAKAAASCERKAIDALTFARDRI